MVVSTYQAASGAGAAAMEELELQTREVFISLDILSYLIKMIIHSFSPFLITRMLFLIGFRWEGSNL